MPAPKRTSKHPSLYETDFHAWAMKNAALLRAGRLSEADVAQIAEELEDMGRSEKRELESRLTVLLAHLLKWQYQPEFRSKSWRYTIKEQRRAATRVLEENPSLKPEAEKIADQAYVLARLVATRETDLDESSFPETRLFTFEQMMDDEFWPG
jgi:hypothetical protein